MSKFILVIFSALMLSSCGVGTYSISSGKSDTALISFTSPIKKNIVVEIDNQQYSIETVKTKTYKTDRKIKQTALNSIKLQSGQHIVKVIDKEQNITFEKKIILSASEHRIIEL